MHLSLMPAIKLIPSADLLLCCLRFSRTVLGPEAGPSGFLRASCDCPSSPEVLSMYNREAKTGRGREGGGVLSQAGLLELSELGSHSQHLQPVLRPPEHPQSPRLVWASKRCISLSEETASEMESYLCLTAKHAIVHCATSGGRNMA